MDPTENPYSVPQAVPLPTAAVAGQPAVVTWYRVYSALMAVLYVVVVVAGIALALFSGMLGSEENPPEMFLIEGIVFAVIGVPLAVMYLVGVFAPTKGWAWIYGIVLIGIGMTSCCLLPACVPLLIFWIRPETQAYFGRKIRAAEVAGA